MIDLIEAWSAVSVIFVLIYILIIDGPRTRATILFHIIFLPGSVFWHIVEWLLGVVITGVIEFSSISLVKRCHKWFTEPV